MEHRHLLPDEFELLVDGEEGFGVAPLLAHIDECAACRADFDARRGVVRSLERLPDAVPSPLFAYHVMQHVQVFEPWYVPALDTARRLLPRSKPARLFAGGTAGLVATALTLTTVWLVSRLDLAAFLFTVAIDRVRGSAAAAVSSMVTSAFGEGIVRALAGSGATGIAIASSAFLLTVLVAAFSLRAVTTASRRRRT